MRPRDAIVAGIRRVIRHHAVASTALYLLGIVAAALYPALARRTFIDENAFLVAQTIVGFDRGDARDALGHYAAALGAARRTSDIDARSDALRGWLEGELDALGMERYRQDFDLDHEWISDDAHPSRSNNATREGTNVHTIARAARGDGREGIVLATPIGARGATPEADAASLALGLVAMRRISSSPWLAKDVAWVVPDARWGPGAVTGTDAWLHEYHAPTALTPFGRIGAIQQAYVLETPHGPAADVATLRVEGFNGALPNQDLLNAPTQLARLAGFSKVGVFTNVNAHAGKLRGVWGIVERGLRAAGLGAKGTRYVSDLSRVSRFMGALAAGTPTGAHASFKSYAVDAVTVRATSSGDGSGSTVGEAAFLRLGTFVESGVRCSNNLLEMLHHSMFYYVMVDDDRFLSIAEYVAPCGLVLVSSLVTAVAIAVIGTKPRHESKKPLKTVKTKRPGDVSLNDDEETVDREGGEHGGDDDAARVLVHDWSSALAIALTAHVAGYATYLVSSRTKSTVWTLAAAYSGAFVTMSAALKLYRASHVAAADVDVQKVTIEPTWAAVKVIALSVQVASLGALTFFNFALALPCAAALAPLQLLAHGRYETAPGGNDGRRGVIGGVEVSALTRAAFTLVAAPLCAVLTVAAAAGTAAATSLGDLSSRHARWGGRNHLLPLVWCVLWPGVVMAACVHLGGVRPREEGREEGKKRR